MGKIKDVRGERSRLQKIHEKKTSNVEPYGMGLEEPAFVEKSGARKGRKKGGGESHGGDAAKGGVTSEAGGGGRCGR